VAVSWLPARFPVAGVNLAKVFCRLFKLGQIRCRPIVKEIDKFFSPRTPPFQCLFE
jgi:hypothetical protein